MNFLIPIANAAGTDSVAFNNLFNKIIDNIITPAIYLIVAVAVVYFVWGVMVFIQNADNPEKRKEGYMHMIWGIIGIFIMISARGILQIIKTTIGVN
jgi:uncharacterized membrane protein YidH (DUF202 family)